MGKVISFRISEFIYAHFSRELPKVLENTLPKLLDYMCYKKAVLHSKDFLSSRIVSVRLSSTLEEHLNKLSEKYGKKHSLLLKLAVVLYHIENEKTEVYLSLPRSIDITHIVAGKKIARRNIKPPIIERTSLEHKRVRVYFYKEDFEKIREHALLRGLSPEEYLYRHIVYQFLNRKSKNTHAPMPSQVSKESPKRFGISLTLPTKVYRVLRNIYPNKLGKRIKEYLLNICRNWNTENLKPIKIDYGEEKCSIRIWINRSEYKGLPSEVKENLEDYLRAVAYKLYKEWGFSLP